MCLDNKTHYSIDATEFQFELSDSHLVFAEITDNNDMA